MLIIDDLSVRIAGRLLIEHASVRIADGSRIGFVGRNGSGKSTLFNVITHDVAAEHGDIEMPSRWRVGRLAQEAPNGPESLIEVVLKADVERTRLLELAETEQDPHEIAEIQIRLADMGAYAAPSRAASILSGLGSRRPTRTGRAQNSPAGGGCGSRSPRRCSRNRTFSSSTSRPTISISKARSGCRTTSRAIRAP